MAAAVASIVTYDPYLDLSCQRDCLQNPLLVANLHSVAVVLRLAESAACVAWCLVAIRDIRNGYRTQVILAATVSAVAVSALRVVTLTFASDDPQAPALRVLHAGLASCVLITGAAIAYELSRPFTARVRLDRLLRDLRTAEEFGLERCLRLAVGDETLALAYRHPSDPALLVDAFGVPVAAGAIEADEHTELSVAGQGVAVVAHRRGAFSAGTLHAVLGAASTLALDNERLRAAALYDLASRRETSVKLIELGDREREQIEHNLHDGAQQGLLGAALALQLARFQTPSPGIDDALHALQELLATVRRIAHGIHPATLAEHGLAPALKSLVDTTNDVPVTLHVDRAIGRLDEPVEISAYEMIQEGLANASAHGARSAEVSVAIADGGLRIDLTDDGQGAHTRLTGAGSRRSPTAHSRSEAHSPSARLQAVPRLSGCSYRSLPPATRRRCRPRTPADTSKKARRVDVSNSQARSAQHAVRRDLLSRHDESVSLRSMRPAPRGEPGAVADADRPPDASGRQLRLFGSAVSAFQYAQRSADASNHAIAEARDGRRGAAVSCRFQRRACNEASFHLAIRRALQSAQRRATEIDVQALVVERTRVCALADSNQDEKSCQADSERPRMPDVRASAFGGGVVARDPSELMYHS